MAVFTSFLLLTFVAILLWRARVAARAAASLVKSVKRDPVPTEWHAVTIQFCEETACQVARELAGKRFLATQAPDLPLSGCVREKCSCRYLHFEDRRKMVGRRAVDNGFDAALYDGPERRPGGDRRNRKATAPKSQED